MRLVLKSLNHSSSFRSIQIFHNNSIFQEDIVKLQVLNLAVKLHLTNPMQTELLCQYVFNLARYDQNYDIRDRARFLKQFVFPVDGKPTILSKNARKVFLANKPAPLLESKYHGREQFQLGSLSHYLNIRATGYHDLPMFPEVAPDSSVRNVEVTLTNEAISEPIEHKPVSTSRNEKSKSGSKLYKKKSFYSESEKSSSEYSSASDGAGNDDEDNEEDESGSEETGDSEESTSGTESSDEDSSDSRSDTSSDDDDESSDESSSEEASAKIISAETKPTKNQNHVSNSTEKPKSNATKADRGNLDLLLDLDDIIPTAPVMTPSLGGFLSPTVLPVGGSAIATSSSKYDLVGPSFIPKAKELLNKINGHGLQINYRFTRGPHLYSAKMVSIELSLRNESQYELENIRISQKNTSAGMELNEFSPIAKLKPSEIVQAVLGVDFNDSMQTVNFDLESSAGASKIALKSTVGELIRAISISESTFREEQTKLRGMNEHNVCIDLVATKLTAVRTKIFEVTNVGAVQRSDDEKLLLFAGQTMSSKSLVLISVEQTSNGNTISLTVNCEKMVIGSMLLNEIKAALKI